MSWVTILWSMGASACLMLALINSLVWFKSRDPAHLLFTITATAAGTLAFFELQVMFAQTPQQLDAVLRWSQVPISITILSLIWFVSLYLKAGRRWLAWTICGLRVLFVLPSLVWGGNTTLLHIPRLERIELFGEALVIYHGTPNPWGLLGFLTMLLCVGFIADAGLTAWRRGDRRKALIVSGGSVFFLAGVIGISVLIIWAGVKLPSMVSLSFQAVVAIMAYELSRDVIHASQLARKLHASESRSLAILRAVPDLMFLQTSDGVFVDHHAPQPGHLFVPPDQFLGRHMRDVLPESVLSTLDPAFRRAAGSAEPVVVEYELPLPDGNRLYEARLVPTANGQILTMVRDVTEAKRAEAALREGEAALQASHRQIRELAGHLIESQDVERARIARELHDDLSQQIAGLSISLSSFKRRLSAGSGLGQLRFDIEVIQQRTVGLTESIRHLSHDLHPSVLTHSGLVAALSAYCTQLGRTQRLAITFTPEGEFDSIATAPALCLYRVAQEALRNVVTHAAAAHVDVRLARVSDHAELTVADDGRGFTVDPARNGHGIGLVSISERVRLCRGTVSIVTELNSGTRIKASVPMTEPALSLNAH